jgi:probable O-glycosylation ligase (exosortase A-associated)
VVGTYSRGGFIGMLAVGGFLWLRSRHKISLMILAIPIVALVTFGAPDKWFERIETISTASEEDASFRSRLVNWWIFARVGLERPFTGIGPYGMNEIEIYKDYLVRYGSELNIVKESTAARAAHSIYFQVLGELGVLGLILYLILAAVTWLNVRRTILLTNDDPRFAWANDLARMMQVSLIAFFVSGAALSMAFYDVYLLITAMGAGLRVHVQTRLAEQTDQADAELRPQPA